MMYHPTANRQAMADTCQTRPRTSCWHPPQPVNAAHTVLVSEPGAHTQAPISSFSLGGVGEA